jgi:hypothetical protein
MCIKINPIEKYGNFKYNFIVYSQPTTMITSSQRIASRTHAIQGPPGIQGIAGEKGPRGEKGGIGNPNRIIGGSGCIPDREIDQLGIFGLHQFLSCMKYKKPFKYFFASFISSGTPSFGINVVSHAF